MFQFITKLLDTNAKEITKLGSIVDSINVREDAARKLKETDFKKKTAEFRVRLGNGETLDDILPEAYALVREAARRIIGERHYDVQLMAAVALHQGKVAEQKTGEGKTLSATPALYLNALTGRGVHLVTVNDYLARRDAGWMATVYELLGVSVSAIISDQSFLYDSSYTEPTATDWRLKHLKPVTRKVAYAADITYGINSEFGFDYLRDNMTSDMSQLSQREYHFAVIDEVDSILIDEARTPHIISAPAEEATSKYYDYAKIVDKIEKEIDFLIDEKLRTAHLTDAGIAKVEKILGVGNIYESSFETVHHIEAALKARALFTREKDYIVKDGQVIIVDEFTGRLLNGRRFSEGIHQAIEAKEGVSIQQESKTLATVSLQNYFRMYEKLSGMTGTAATEAEEFKKIYNLDVIVIPTNKDMIREDYTDMVYKTTRAKYEAVTNDIAEHYKKGQPVLVGTTSIDKNEIISDLLNKKGVPHQVLNAKNHLREAMIISDAGKRGAITVATNMAGRGVDIILGGAKKEKWEYPPAGEAGEDLYEKDLEDWQKRHDEVVSLGGLYVLGTDRHESRRIDNQLRGRSGRQADPGSSRFYVSLEDDIMRLFGGDQVSKLMTIFNLPEDVPLEHPMVSRALEQAQIKVEGFHFDNRKHLVEYDDVLNKQREIVYRRRRKILEGENQKETIVKKVEAEVSNVVAIYSSDQSHIEREKIVSEFCTIIPFEPASQQQLLVQLQQLHTANDIVDFFSKVVVDVYDKREAAVTPEVMRQLERWVSLSVIDNLWMDHLDAIDDLREGIGLRGYGQRDPLVEYKNEAFSMFERLMGGIDSEIVQRIFKVHVEMSPNQTNQSIKTSVLPTETVISKAAKRMQTNAEASVKVPLVIQNKLGRNDPCPCGSGLKYKKCGLISAPYHKS